MANVADIHTIIEIPGRIGIYEVMTGQALLVKECADREETEAHPGGIPRDHEPVVD